jgi:transposase
MPVTPFRLLQLLRKTVFLLPTEVRIVGIDDWCWKKGTTYRTIIVNLETRQPIELLPDRSVETVEAWLRSHPEITIVSRDRGGDYAAAARNGAPQAEQKASSNNSCR